MKKLGILLILGLLSACAIKTPVQNKYKLEAFGTSQAKAKKESYSIFISAPIATTGYQTEQMLYVSKPFELSAFTKNSWVGDPASMLSPLIVQSLQSSKYFFAVTSIPYADKSDFRLDTQLLTLQQNFLVRPSVLDFIVKNVVTDTKNSQVIASRIFTYHMPCSIDAPYGGVLAANQVTKQYTKQLTDFVIDAISHSRR